jgi:hypothetical protein
MPQEKARKFRAIRFLAKIDVKIQNMYLKLGCKE